MKYLIIDTENSGALRNKAHPFDPRNRMCMFGAYDGNDCKIYPVQYHPDSLYGESIRSIKKLVDQADLLVGFNIKYDLHWLRRYGISTHGKMIWDCQLAEFIISFQKSRYPSLKDTCAKYGIIPKKDTLAGYLEQDIDVDGIPIEELTDYLEGDLYSTNGLYILQKDLIKPYWPLFNLQCQDLLVLQEMEWNGLKFNLSLCSQKVNECLIEESSIKKTLSLLVPEEFINWSSNDHLSVVLFGGQLRIPERIPNGAYKTGSKAGQTKYSIQTKVYTFPRLVSPSVPVAKAGFFSVAEPVLKELKATGKAKAIIDLVLRLGEVEKLRTTYFQGFPDKFREYNWEDSLMHGSINQCVARTGRTSSSNPNLQNIPEESKVCFESRFN